MALLAALPVGFLPSAVLMAERSIYRPVNPALPKIAIAYEGSDDWHELRSSYLEYRPLFKTFDSEYLAQHTLPEGRITYRNDPEHCVESAELEALIEEVVELVKKSRRIKKSMGHFTVLKSCDFNPRTCAGLLVLRCKDHPFVVKLFMETPESFVQPFSKGFEPGCFFVIGGGASRYLTGFTRIKNAEFLREYLAKTPLWSGVVDAPRKWFLQPRNSRWMVMRGCQMDDSGEVHEIRLPSVYAVVCDLIKFDRRLSLRNRHERQFSIAFTQELNNRIDPNITNFVIEQDTGKIVIVDTEHFPTMVGLREPLSYKSYASWYAQLFCRGISCRYGSTRLMRRGRRRSETTALLCVSLCDPLFTLYDLLRELCIELLLYEYFFAGMNNRCVIAPFEIGADFSQ